MLILDFPLQTSIQNVVTTKKDSNAFVGGFCFDRPSFYQTDKRMWMKPERLPRQNLLNVTMEEVENLQNQNALIELDSCCNARITGKSLKRTTTRNRC